MHANSVQFLKETRQVNLHSMRIIYAQGEQRIHHEISYMVSAIDVTPKKRCFRNETVSHIHWI